MKYTTKMVAMFLVVTMLNTSISYAFDKQLAYVKNEPVTFKSEEETIPVKTETKISGWTWLVLALMLVGGGTAYYLIKEKSDDKSGDKGDATIHW